MSNPSPTKKNLVSSVANSPIDFRKKIASAFHIQQINVLADQWGIHQCDVIWRLITDGIMNEKKKREDAPNT